MPEVSYREIVEAPLSETWDFVKDIENWAELVPWYEGVQIINETDSEWKVRGDIGILTKLVTMRVHVTEWVEGSHVSFNVVCVEEPLEANGSLQAQEEGPESSALTFTLAAEAGGMLGPVVNALIGPVMKRVAPTFAGSIKRQIEQQRPGATTQEGVA